MRLRPLLAAVLMLWASAAQAQDVKVKIGNFTFQPATVTVHLGDRVEWDNEDDIPHTVTQSDFAFLSQALDTGERYQFTFVTKGDYPYFCSLHPHMVGKIIVVD